MGIIIGKLRKKKTTSELLETIDKEIKDIEEYRKSTERTHKRIVGRFIIISVIVYLLTAFMFYFYYFPATFYDRLFYIIPLLLAPVIILTVKRVLSIYYKWKISKKQNKLTNLRDEKKKLLEKVMETETYKIAKTILEKFAPETVTARKSSSLLLSEYATPQKQLLPTAPNTAMTGGLRQRALPTPINQQLVPSMTPARPIQVPSVASTVSKHAFQVVPRGQPTGAINTPLPMPRSIVPRERSVLDKMVDYLVGDGPSNRFALICKNCFSHNGMAFSEEFEYISFRCCYCFSFNPARKQRPAPPKLELDIKSSLTLSSSDTSGSEKQSPSDTDSEPETMLQIKAVEAEEVSEVLEELKNLEMESSKSEEFIPMDVDVSLTKIEEASAPVEQVAEPIQVVPADEKKEIIVEETSNSNDTTKD